MENLIYFPRKKNSLSISSPWEKRWIVLCCGKSHQFSTKGKTLILLFFVGKRMDSFVLWEISSIFHERKTQSILFFVEKEIGSFCAVENRANFPRRKNSNPYFSSWEKLACSWKKRFAENIFENSRNHHPSPF